MIDFKNGSIVKLKKSGNETANDIIPLLIQDEQIIGCYKSIRDYVVFTDKRLIAANVQGVTGKKKDFSSIPYSKIQAFSVETAGVFDLDSELEIYISGLGKIHLEFSGNNDIIKIGQYISNRIL